MKKLLVILPLVICFIISCQYNPNKNISSNFIGTWTLIKCVAIQKDGQITFPYGENPAGQISYDAKGNVMVEIMNQEIKKFNNENPSQGTPEEIIPAYNGLLAYYGTYKVLADSNIIIHSIKASSFPNWVGQNQKRHFEFKKNTLTLRTPNIGSVQYELIWEKN